MRYYLSASLRDISKAQTLRDDLSLLGNMGTYDWTQHGKLDDDGLTDALISEIRGVLDTDLFVMILPGGRGAHVELGVALSNGKRVFLWDETGEFLRENLCGFYLYPTVNWVVGYPHHEVAEIIDRNKDALGQRWIKKSA